MDVSGSYQGIPIIDGEWTQRVGTDFGSGWVRVLRSDLGGSIPKAAKLIQLKEYWERLLRNFVPHRKQSQAETDSKDGEGSSSDASKSGGGLPGPATKKNPGETVASTRTKPAPPGFSNLEGPYGDLIFLTAKEGEDKDEIPETRMFVPNIFWLEAVIEEINSDQAGVIDKGKVVQFGREAVVRIELADERVLWPLGGYVFGRRNRLINEVNETMAGRVFQWDPTENNPSSLIDITEDLSKSKLGRPIIDPKTIFGQLRPWTAYGLIVEAAQQLAGPPEVQLISQDASSKRPWNIDYGGATIAKNAVDDVLNKYNLVIAPSYKGTFAIFDRGQNANKAVTHAGGKFKTFESHSEVPEVFNSDRNNAGGSVENVITPISVEIVGEKIIEEIMCPRWVMVMRDDGTIFNKKGLGRQGAWVDARELIKAWDLDFNDLAKAVLASWDKNDSKIYEFIGDKEDPKIQKRISILKANFFRSFMVAPGPFREYLPILKNRTEGFSHELGFENMGIQRTSQIFCDGWAPNAIREIGGEALFKNFELESMPPESYKVADADGGVITFNDPRGIVIYRSGDFSFLNEVFAEGEGIGQGGGLSSGGRQRAEKVDALAAEIQKIQDQRIFAAGRDGPYVDSHRAAREAMFNFLKNNKWKITAKNVPILDPKTLASVTERLDQSFTQEISVQANGDGLVNETVNLSECILSEPKIEGVWGWERNYGNQDDWFRFRGGDFPELNPYPIKVKGLRQYVSIDGESNKQLCDALAKIQLGNFLVKERKATVSSVLRFAGFHMVLTSGTVPEVSFKMAVGQPPTAETIIHENRFLRGTEGRPSPIETWSAHNKKIVPEGGKGHVLGSILYGDAEEGMTRK